MTTPRATRTSKHLAHTQKYMRTQYVFPYSAVLRISNIIFQDVQAIYVGTPHTLHYENARDALLAGKHVLCEKATTSNAPELKDLLKLAKEKNLFFMEAMWTRFQPITKEIKRVAEEGSLGEPVVLHADLSGDFDIESKLPLYLVR